MKKYFSFHRVILLLSIIAATLFGCSKDKTIMNPVNENNIVSNSAERVRRAGSVTGIILPTRIEVKIRIYNRYFSSDSYYYTRDGKFRFDGIPAGLYTMEITQMMTAAVVEIPEVKVQWEMVTDIGRVILP